MKRHIKIKILSDKKTSTFLSLKTEAPEMLICPLSQIVCTAHYSVTQIKFVQVELPFFLFPRWHPFGAYSNDSNADRAGDIAFLAANH